MLSWEIASVAAKILSLAGSAGMIGGLFSLFLARRLASVATQQIRDYLLFSAVAGSAATLLFFFLQIGGINESGLGGMLDWQMALIIGQSSLGYTTGIKLGAFMAGGAIAAMYLPDFQHAASKIRQGFTYGLCLLVVFALGVAFILTGHVTSLGKLAQFAMSLHVIAVFLWIGSLWPLLLFCDSQLHQVEPVQRVMEEFGKLAIGIVALLVGAGVFVLSQLLESWTEIYSTAYGRGMLLKLAFVAGLLLLGATNKLRLVPRMVQENGTRILARSIRFEIGLAGTILAVTSYLTIIIGK